MTKKEIKILTEIVRDTSEIEWYIERDMRNGTDNSRFIDGMRHAMCVIRMDIYNKLNENIYKNGNKVPHSETRDKQLDIDMQYFKIYHHPDLTETGLAQKQTLVCVNTKKTFMAKELVEDWCFETMGRRVKFVQGVAPTENWHIYKSTAEEFKERRQYCVMSGWGKQTPAQIYLKTNRETNRLVETDPPPPEIKEAKDKVKFYKEFLAKHNIDDPLS